MRIVAAGAALLLACGVAWSAAYDDFARGLSANVAHDDDLAISAFTAALAAADLNPSQIPVAYRGRAIAYLRKTQCKEAQADLDAALKLSPADVESLYYRGEADMCAKDLAAAESDFGAAIALKPLGYSLFSRGRVRFRQGNFAGAADDFAAAVRLQPQGTYYILWLEMARSRGGTLDTKVADDDMDHVDRGWPKPILSLYAGREKPQEVVGDAADDDKTVAAAQLCEANFYVAEWYLAHLDAAALPLFETAAKDCPKDMIEGIEAKFQLGQTK